MIRPTSPRPTLTLTPTLGSGKTVAYLLPLIASLSSNTNEALALTDADADADADAEVEADAEAGEPVDEWAAVLAEVEAAEKGVASPAKDDETKNGIDEGESKGERR